jgi:aminoglycoside 3-N-acetyltransferase
VSTLIRSVKDKLRGPRRRAQKFVAQTFSGFGERELVSALTRVGLASGNAVMVHSSSKGFEGFRGTLHDAIRILEESVGEQGTLMMPTLSMTGSAIEFARSGKIFDPRTTPSQVGLLTEIFRRSKGVQRSLHPTHSVAAWGADTEWWLAGHPEADTPCGAGSPFHRLLERNGKVLLAGTGISALTFYHCAEEILERKLPTSPFTAERFQMKYRSLGEVRDTAEMRLYDPDVSRRRNLAPLEIALRQAGRWRQVQVGTLDLILLSAKDVQMTLEEMAQRSVFCYDGQ